MAPGVDVGVCTLHVHTLGINDSVHFASTAFDYERSNLKPQALECRVFIMILCTSLVQLRYSMFMLYYARATHERNQQLWSELHGKQ